MEDMAELADSVMASMPAAAISSEEDEGDDLDEEAPEHHEGSEDAEVAVSTDSSSALPTADRAW